MLKAVIVDDFENIRKKNIGLIKENCPNVDIIAEADSVESAVKIIKKYTPDLVFLDIELTDGTGFEVLQKLSPITFKVIFITGFHDFAIKAFKFSAIDYILKPLDVDELVVAVKRAEELIYKEQIDIKLNSLFLNIERPNNLKKLVVKTSDRIYSINIQDIIRCEADRNYTRFHLIDGQKLFVAVTLKDYDELLSPIGFFRLYQSHLINLNFFDYYIKSDGGIVVMKDKSQLPISSKKKEAFLKLIE